MTFGFIYMIKNKVNGKIYIGQTTEDAVETRWNNHIYALNRTNHDNSHFQNSWNKYGENNFEFLVLKEINKHEINDHKVYQDYLDKLEDDYILLYNSINPSLGYNKRRGDRTGKFPQEIKDKISKACSGEKMDFMVRNIQKKQKKK